MYGWLWIINMNLPSNSRPLYRVLTKNSILDFGKYKYQEIGNIIKVNPNYIAWLYYMNSYISFPSDILKELEITPINKPGIDADALQRWNYNYYLEQIKERGEEVVISERKERLREYYRKQMSKINEMERIFHSKTRNQAFNHGHLK